MLLKVSKPPDNLIVFLCSFIFIYIFFLRIKDADEEEDYIYSNSHSRSSSLTSLPGMPQLQTIPFPHMPSDNNYGYSYHMPSNMYGTIPGSHRTCSNYLHRPPLYGGY